MATQTIYATKDTFANNNFQDTNYGTTQFLYIDYGVFLTYIGFDITSAIPSAATSSVLLYLYQHDTESYAYSCYLKRITGSWNETTLTWNLAPAVTATNQKSHTFPSGSPTWHSIDITKLYKDAKTAGNELGVRIEIQSASSDTLHLSSRESAYDAYIVITPIEYYVKVGGNDASAGDSWANAWATINKAATTAVDGTIVHIGFGDYIAEPAGNKIAPQNVGASGITYHCETATTGGGTGTVSVEQNA